MLHEETLMWLGLLNIEFCGEVICFEFSLGFQLDHWSAFFLNLVAFSIVVWLFLKGCARERTWMLSAFKIVKLE